MVRTKKPTGTGSMPPGSPRRGTGTLDEFLSTPAGLWGTAPSDNMAAVSPSTTSGGDSMPDFSPDDALLSIRAELSRIGSSMLTKADTDLAALTEQVDTVEAEARICCQQHRAAETAATRQGNMLLSLRRQVEDLENRSRRHNVRIRGLPEPDTEPLVITLQQLFGQLLGRDAPPNIRIDRAHRALGQARPDGRPKDVVCCLHSFPQKEQIMAAARNLPTVSFRGADLALFQDLSGLTLDARRALRPITAALRDKGIPYKWGFPFSLQLPTRGDRYSRNTSQEIIGTTHECGDDMICTVLVVDVPAFGPVGGTGAVWAMTGRQVEDLENRSRRHNVRIRGLPEPDTEPLVITLQQLFGQLLGRDAPPNIRIDRAHRALGQARPDGRPKDVVCCLHSFPQKEQIMAAARNLPTVSFRGADLALFQDLSGLTLDARRALRPITAALRDKGIPYKWGFPFSLQARQGSSWHSLRMPDDAPRFARALHLPPIRIRNWLLDEPLAPRRGEETGLQPSATHLGRLSPPRRWGGPAGAGEDQRGRRSDLEL
ncbi:Hypothetical predicted protein [Pelobates cultripes]|uniref:Uncharacterized protein n=1 Tax=Pelobates cultripes TaxID=61616 RepID=A0AAD1WL39_PELCU|nr:Hypothetical predicted protein [Pelobates cultripes]